MQKKSRFLTGLLSAVMALTLFALPATAANEQTDSATIDPNATCSITVHKYEYDGTNNKKGTGNANDGVPEGAMPLNGVGFTVYQIWDKDALIKYYDGHSDITGLNQKLDWHNYAEKAADGSYQLNHKAGYTATEVKAQQLTGAAGEKPGVATFNGLSVGLYLVLETKLPDQVSKAAVPAIISLPMQKDSDNKTAAENVGNVTEWLYNIHIFPKNSTSYLAAHLVKKGYTGGREDGPLANVKFNLYKYKGTDANPQYTEETSSNWVQVTNKTTAAGENKGEELNLVTNADGEITVDGLAKGVYCFVEQGMVDAKDKTKDAYTAYIISKKPVYFTVEADDKVSYIGDTTVTKNDDTAALVENYKPDIEKKVQKSNGDLDKRADYNVGDLVPYVVTVDVPKNIANLKVFTVTDTPTNLEFVNDDENHKLVVTSVDEQTTIPSTGYMLNKVNNGFNLAFTKGTLDSYAGQKIKIKYYDKLLKTAGNTTGKNTVALIYNNKLGTDGTPEGEGGGKTIKIQDDTVVYSFGIKVKKTDGNGTELDGVKFDLYRVDATGNKSLADFGWTDATDATKNLKLVESNLETKNGGNISVTGLANGEYYLVETATLPEYNMLSKAVKVELNITYTASWTDKMTYDTDGNLIHHSMTNLKETFANGDQDGDPTFVTTNIINRKGFTLPTTGGFGTLLFSGIGALLVVGGIGVLMGTKKKKDNA